MHVQAQEAQPRPTAAMPLPAPATDPCPHCGTLPLGAPHGESCFPAFQRALIARYPGLPNAVSLEEAEAIERIFRFWAGLMHALRAKPYSVGRCVERRWGEVGDYVERLLARHARRHATDDASTTAAAS